LKNVSIRIAFPFVDTHMDGASQDGDDAEVISEPYFARVGLKNS
jgi:hypothetical protein